MENNSFTIQKPEAYPPANPAQVLLKLRLNYDSN